MGLSHFRGKKKFATRHVYVYSKPTLVAGRYGNKKILRPGFKKPKQRI